jgi:hypothetical protein
MSRPPREATGSLVIAVRQAAGTHSAALPSPGDEATRRAGGSRRRRLWELPHRIHCPIVGVCFSCAELRGIMRQLMLCPPATTDYALHTMAVSACEQRGRLTELLQRKLDSRHRLQVDALSSMRSPAELRTAWRQSCASGAEVPGMLWACSTHPAIDGALEQEIFGDIHMLQHQLGSGTRADLAQMRAQRQENERLCGQLDALRSQVEQLRSKKAEAARRSEREIAAMRAELAAAETRRARLARELAGPRDELPAPRDRQLLLQRTADAVADAAACRQRSDRLEAENARLREFARYAEETIEALAKEADALPPTLAEPDLSGKRVLCVGGRPASLGSYRLMVEQSGGQFLHHDGGLEHGRHRIDDIVAAADLVICQAGCVSHNAYWRVKEHCKRNGKPCVFVANAGVASFGRAIGELGQRQARSQPESGEPE